MLMFALTCKAFHTSIYTTLNWIIGRNMLQMYYTFLDSPSETLFLNSIIFPF